MRADTFIDSIDKRFQVLAQSPQIGRLRNELIEGMYSFPIGRYLIFYRILVEGIEVVRILHGARDINPDFF